MAYILGISVPAQVSIGMALQRIKGISTTKAKWLCAATNVGFFLPVEQVNQYQLNELQSLLENSLITGTALNHFTNSKIQKLKFLYPKFFFFVASEYDHMVCYVKNCVRSALSRNDCKFCHS